MRTNVQASKACEHCWTVYSPTSNRSRFCSDQCAVLGRIQIDGNGCWIWTGTLLRGGYGSVQIAGHKSTAHRLSYKIFFLALPDDVEVCHRCDVRACVNPSHLFLGTRTDNMIDCVRKGRNDRKLTKDDVAAIRASVGLSKAELGRRYGVTDVMIGKIIRGEWWKEFLPSDDVTLASSGKSPHTPLT